jgi:integrase
MANKWIKSQYTGVRYRDHTSRIYQGKPDRYFSIRYKLNGKLKEEALGWSSEGWNAQKASFERASLRKAQTLGEGPQTLGEKRQLAVETKKAEQRKKEKATKDRITFKEYFDETYFPIAKQNKDKESWRREKNLFEIWINPVIGLMPLKDIRPLNLEKIKKTMFNKGREPRSIEYALAVIRQVFNSAKRNGLAVGESPTIGVRKPKVDNRRIRFLTHEEADMLLEDLAVRSQQLHDIALLSLHCGPRASEIFKLTWGCVNLIENNLTLLDTKTSSRIVPMTTKAKEMLESKKHGSPDQLVFTNKKGKKIQQVSNAYRTAVKELGFNNGVNDSRMKVCFHTLRHTYASWLVQGGENLYTVGKLLGHSTIAMTERYSHLAPDTLKTAVKNFEKNLSDKRAESKKVIDMIKKNEEN